VVDIAGNTYMLVAPDSANGGGDALICKWDDVQSAIELIQNFTTSGWNFLHFVTVGADTFLALRDRIYKYCRG
jgi:hypothetical protein